MDEKITVKNVSASRLPAAEAFDSHLFLWIETDGYYWRTAHILSLSAGSGDGRSFTMISYTADPEKEDDEYLLLKAFTERFPKISAFVTFGGTSFLIPFLTAKMRAYDLPDPFGEGCHTDLAARYRSLYFLLRLPSRRLSDYGEAIGLSGSPDAVYLAALTACDPYLAAFAGDADLLDTALQDESLILTFRLRAAVPRVFSLNVSPFYLTGREERLVLSARMNDGKVRMYYPDFRSYEFLPNEGYAVHRSVSAFVRSSRRIPATRDTAFTLVSADILTADREKAAAFAKQALSYLTDTISMKSEET